MKIMMLALTAICAFAADTDYQKLSKIAGRIAENQTALHAIPVKLAWMPAHSSRRDAAIAAIRTRGAVVADGIVRCDRMEASLVEADHLLQSILVHPPLASALPMAMLRAQLMTSLRKKYAAERVASSPAERSALTAEIGRDTSLIHWIDIEFAEQQSQRSAEMQERKKLQKLLVGLRESKKRVRQLHRQLEFTRAVDRAIEAKLSTPQRGQHRVSSNGTAVSQ